MARRVFHYLAIVLLFLSGCNALLPPLCCRKTSIHTPSIHRSPRTIPPKTVLFQQQQQSNPELQRQQQQQQQQQEQQQQRQQQQPLLARAYARALRVAIRIATLFGRIDGLHVQCEASSNLNVVRGKISSLRMSVDRISSPLLFQTKANDVQLVGTDLELGFGPLLLLLTPFLLVSTRQVLSLMLCLVLGPKLLFQMSGRRRNNNNNNNNTLQSSVATYRVGLTGADLSAPNSLLRMILHRSMDHLLRNSVVGTILAGSASASAQQQQQQQQQTMVSEELTSALDENSTKLEMKRVAVGENGRLVVDAVADFPDPSTDGTTRSRLDFVVRLSLSPLDDDLMRIATAAANSNTQYLQDPAVNGNGNGTFQQQQQQPQQPNGCGIMVTNAEVKASFNRDTMGVPLEVFGKTLQVPDLWIPVVSGGLAYSFGRRHRVVSIESDPSRDRLDICGALYFNGDAPVLLSPTNRNNVFGLWKNPFTAATATAGPSALPPPPPPPPPPRPRPKRPPALPSARD